MSKEENSEIQENVYRHPCTLQGLSYRKFISVSNKILNGEHLLIGFPDTLCVEGETEAEPQKCTESLKRAMMKA